MKRTLSMNLAIGTAALALALGGCKKEKDEGAKGGETAGEAKGGEAAGDSPSAAAGAASAGVAGKGFAVFPADSGMIIGINFDSVRKSGLWEKYKPMIEQQMASEMADIKEACGIDPMTMLESAIVGANPTTEAAVVVVKGIPRATMKDCGTKMAAKEGKKIEITEEGNLNHIVADGEETWIAWLDDTTMVMSPEQDKAYIEARAAGEGGLAEGSKLMELLKNVDTSASVYLVGDIAQMGPAASAVPGGEGLFASIKLTDGLSIDAGMRFGTADSAKAMTDMANQQMQAMKGQGLPPAFGKVIDKAKVKTVDKDMVVQLSLTGAELEEVSKAVQGMAGMLGGGLGGM